MADDVTLLAGVPLFGALPVDLLAHLAQAATTVSVGAGELLFRQGDQGDSLYVVRSGRVEVLVDDEVVRVHGRGEAFGELALISGGVRTASVRARRDSELLAVHRAEFDRLLATRTEFSLALIHELGLRLRRGDVPVARPPTSTVLALLPLQARLPESAVRDLAEALCAELARRPGSVRLLQLDEDDRADAWGARLDAAESAHTIVVLVATRCTGPWWTFCARQADRALAVVDPALVDPALVDPALVGPAVGAAELAGCDLLAFGSTGLPGWLDLLTPAAHHLVDQAAPAEDVARLARRVSGRSVGLVLSGGGARAMAHIGVVEVLQRAGLCIDRVGGTSMGAFMAGLVAMGLDAGDMLRVARTELAQRRPFSDYTLSRHGLIRTKRAAAMLDRVFGTATIEEQRRALFAVSVDLVGAQEVVHRRGRIAQAVGLSIRLPGVAPPAWADGKLHVDGGVLDNLPIEVMAADGQGPVIAVDVMRRFDPAPGLRPGENLPSAVDTIARAMVLASWQRAETGRSLAHTLITPTLDGVGMFDFRRIDEIVEGGRRAAEKALPALGGLLGG